MLDKMAVAFVLGILFLIYAVANPTDAAEVVIAFLVGAALVYSVATFCQWWSHRAKR